MRPDSVAHYSALNGRLNRLCDCFTDACEGAPAINGPVPDQPAQRRCGSGKNASGHSAADRL
jgi:hypothetical protein